MPYQTLVTPLIFLGMASLALKKASHWEGVASLMAVNAKQCMSFFSPAFTVEARKRAAAQAATRIGERVMGTRILEGRVMQ